MNVCNIENNCCSYRSRTAVCIHMRVCGREVTVLIKTTHTVHLSETGFSLWADRRTKARTTPATQMQYFWFVYTCMYDGLKTNSQLFYTLQLSLTSYKTSHQHFWLQHLNSLWWSLSYINSTAHTILYLCTLLLQVSQHIYPSFLEAFWRLNLALWMVASYKMFPHWGVCSVPDTDSLSNEGEIKRNTYSEQTDTNAANSYWW